MSKANDYLKSSIWHREKIDDPFETLDLAFSRAKVCSYKKLIQEVLNSACNRSIWNKDSPGDLLFYFEGIESIINSCYVIERNKVKINYRQRVCPDNLHFYCVNYPELAVWGNFPGELSVKEFSNPILVMRYFFKYGSISEWKEILSDIFRYALTQDSIFHTGIDYDTLTLYLHLIKLVEAAHIVQLSNGKKHLKTIDKCLSTGKII